MIMKPCYALLYAVMLTSGILLAPVSVAKDENGVAVSASIAFDSESYGGGLFSDNEVAGHSSSRLRRLKLSSKYKYNSIYSGKISTKYAVYRDKFVLDDAYIRMRLGSAVTLKAGQFKEPFGMEKQQGWSSQYLMERSIATNVLTFSRKPGVSLLTTGKHWRWDAAVMQVKAKSDDYNDSNAYVSRFTFAPIVKNKAFLHFGAGFSTRGGVEKNYDIDEPLIAHSTGNLFHSAKIRAKNIRAGNLEFAGKYGPFVLQSEALYQKVKDRDSVTHEFGGYYTSALWTLMGKSRGYADGEIEFGNTKKNTLEMAFRYSVVDGESRREGDIAEVMSIGFNYYVKRAVRISLEYERANVTTFNSNDWDTRVKGDSISARFQLMM